MRVWMDGVEITGLCTGISVEKDLQGAGAQCEIALVCAPMDSELPRLNPACGQWVEVAREGVSLFSGRVEQVSYDAAALALTLLAYDPANLLAKNHCRGPYRGTPEAITRQLCALCGLEAGEIWAGEGAEVQLGAACGRSVYRTICNLYDDACVTEWQEGKVRVYPVGQQRAALESGRLVALSARNTIRQAVNQVAVYSKGEVAALAVNETEVTLYGPRRRDEHLSLKYESAEAQARAGLEGVSRQARLTLTGLSPVKCGQIITLDKPLMGVYGEYLVERVVWHCKEGQTFTELGVVSR